MPKRRRSRKRSRKSSRGRVRRGQRRRLNGRGWKNPYVGVSRNLLTSKSAIVKHRYVSTHALNAPLNSVDYIVLRGNSMFLPTVAPATGHQPMGFDQMSLLFNTYQVISCTVKATFWTGESTQTSPVVVGLKASRDVSIVALNGEWIMESRWAPFKLLPINKLGATVQTRTVSMTRKTKNMLDLADLKDNQHTKAAITASPTSLWYIHAFATGSSSLADPPPLDVMLELEYTARWTDPVQHNQS